MACTLKSMLHIAVCRYPFCARLWVSLFSSFGLQWIFDSTIISESSRSSKETAPSADEHKVISRTTANNYQVELDSGVFEKGGGSLEIDDKKRRIKELKNTAVRLFLAPAAMISLDEDLLSNASLVELLLGARPGAGSAWLPPSPAPLALHG